jgi:hypothetical protein
MSDPNEYVRPDTPEGIVTHHMGNGLRSPCLLQPADVYSGLQAGFTTDWSDVDCPACLEAKPGGLVDQLATMKHFYVTFGVKYAHETHPHWPAAHPDGWLEVIAPDYDTARALVHSYIGNVFAFMYEADRFDRKWHPRGRLATISADGVLIPVEGVEPPTPLPVEEPTRTVLVSWYETTHYTDTFEVPADFDLNGDDAEEQLEEQICDMSSEQMDKAFNGTTDRQITDKEWTP